MAISKENIFVYVAFVSSADHFQTLSALMVPESKKKILFQRLGTLAGQSWKGEKLAQMDLEGASVFQQKIARDILQGLTGSNAAWGRAVYFHGAKGAKAGGMASLMARQIQEITAGKNIVLITAGDGARKPFFSAADLKKAGLALSLSRQELFLESLGLQAARMLGQIVRDQGAGMKELWETLQKERRFTSRFETTDGDIAWIQSQCPPASAKIYQRLLQDWPSISASGAAEVWLKRQYQNRDLEAIETLLLHHEPLEQISRLQPAALHQRARQLQEAAGSMEISKEQQDEFERQFQGYLSLIASETLDGPEKRQPVREPLWEFIRQETARAQRQNLTAKKERECLYIEKEEGAFRVWKAPNDRSVPSLLKALELQEDIGYAREYARSLASEAIGQAEYESLEALLEQTGYASYVFFAGPEVLEDLKKRALRDNCLVLAKSCPQQVTKYLKGLEASQLAPWKKPEKTREEIRLLSKGLPEIMSLQQERLLCADNMSPSLVRQSALALSKGADAEILLRVYKNGSLPAFQKEYRAFLLPWLHTTKNQKFLKQALQKYSLEEYDYLADTALTLSKRQVLASYLDKGMLLESIRQTVSKRMSLSKIQTLLEKEHTKGNVTKRKCLLFFSMNGNIRKMISMFLARDLFEKGTVWQQAWDEAQKQTELLEVWLNSTDFRESLKQSQSAQNPKL